MTQRKRRARRPKHRPADPGKVAAWLRFMGALESLIEPKKQRDRKA